MNKTETPYTFKANNGLGDKLTLNDLPIFEAWNDYLYPFFKATTDRLGLPAPYLSRFISITRIKGAHIVHIQRGEVACTFNLTIS